VLRFPGRLADGALALSSPVPREESLGVPLYVAGQRVSPRTTVAESLIKDGAVISLGSPEGCVVPESAGLVEVRVVGGPRSGAIHRLSAGQADIGSNPGGLGHGGTSHDGSSHDGSSHGGGAAAVRIQDPTVPAYAARVAVDGLGRCQVAAYDGVPVTLDRAPLAAPAQWLPGQQLAIGETLLTLAPYQPPDAALTRSADGTGIDFNRPPRLLPPQRTTTFTLPAPPQAAERRPLPIVMSLLPLVMGVAMAVFLRQVYLLAMAGLSPVMLIGSALSDRRQGRKSSAVRQSEYAEHKARIEADAADALNAEGTALREQFPDPAAVLAIAAGPRRRLWERRRTDPDFLLLRVGTADLPSAVRLTDPVKDEHRRTVAWPLPDAPATIPLTERKVIGLAGPADSGRGVGRWLVAQAAALHSPNDLRIYVLTDSTGKASWQWVRWLPHCRPEIGRPEIGRPGIGASGGGAGQAGASYAAQVGNDAETVATRIAELLAIIAQRQAAVRQQGMAGGDSSSGFGPTGFRTEIVVVLDGSRKLRSLPGVIQLLREGPDVGVYAICLDTDERLLPAECQAVAVLGPDGLRVQQMMTATITGARPDHVTPGWCGRVARAIAPIRDVSADSDGDGLPGSVRLLDVLGLAHSAAKDGPAKDVAVMARAIAARWRAGGRSTVAMVGESYDGPFGIDLKKDGPHGLVAGTTGSGKSELLQTLVASLAVANRPDEMTFVLIDYKGGSAFADCARLPHTVGMVTDLSPHLVERALRSLSAELTRREQLLARAGAKDIEDYQRERDKSLLEGPESRTSRGYGPPGPGVSPGGTVLPRETVRNGGYRGSSPRETTASPRSFGPAGAGLIRSRSLRSGPPEADIGGYGGSLPREKTALPRLVIVIDEFASMVRDLPDFVTGLVNIAQRGRSLGIHLILATQRPSGVVSADIRANTNLRIALRVTDPGESADVVDSPDAASIGKGTPGRGYVRLGHASLIPFQAGRVGGPRPGPGPAGGAERMRLSRGAGAEGTARPEVWLAPVDWAGVGRPTPAPAVARRAEEEITDLKVLVEEIRRAAMALSIPARPSPWLPPLPDSVQLDEIWPGTARRAAGIGRAGAGGAVNVPADADGGRGGSGEVGAGDLGTAAEEGKGGGMG
jgi:S-DNA-T family DNA segregation ATPase FtsK/SpoIIIE